MKGGKRTVLISSSQRAMRVPRRGIADLVRFVERAQKRAIREVDVAVLGAREMSQLNRKYLSHAGPTDVISFDLSDPAERGIRVQLAVCADVAVREARRRGFGPQRELLLYVVHGLLHAMGYDDLTAPGAARMRARQEELLAAFLSRRPGGQQPVQRATSMQGENHEGPWGP